MAKFSHTEFNIFILYINCAHYNGTFKKIEIKNDLLEKKTPCIAK